MRVRIKYTQEGFDHYVFDGDNKLLSKEAKIFVAFVTAFIKPALDQPKRKVYKITVELLA